jgi:purine-nucleoside phosphorylase
MMDEYDRVQEAVAAIRGRSSLQPQVGIILGSGLGPLADDVENADVVPYEEIPHFPTPTAPGHAGRLLLGTLEGVPVVVMAGRVHLYEGLGPRAVVFPLRTMALLGAKRLVVSNAAGGVNSSFHPGTLMLISDHINFSGRNPLLGHGDAAFGPEFPDMTDVYTRRLRDLARKVAAERQVEVAEGVYMAFLGPSFETPAEIRMARSLGADAVGMSTVTEVIAARQLGMEILGISCISNMAAGMQDFISTEEVMDTANSVRAEFTSLVRGAVAEMGS